VPGGTRPGGTGPGGTGPGGTRPNDSSPGGSGPGSTGQDGAGVDTDTGNLATVGWLDYHAPSGVGPARQIGPALDGAGPLSAFSAGLRVDNTDTGSDQTMLGYSYGSVVVGAAAGRHGLSDDRIILVGSPGTTVDHAAISASTR